MLKSTIHLASRPKWLGERGTEYPLDPADKHWVEISCIVASPSAGPLPKLMVSVSPMYDRKCSPLKNRHLALEHPVHSASFGDRGCVTGEGCILDRSDLA